MQRQLIILFAPLLLAAALTGCGGSMRETLGVNKKAPDEFRVVSRPPLSIPPEFSLRPPSEPGESPEVDATREDARALVLGRGDGDAAYGSGALMPGTADSAVAPVSSATLGNSDAESTFLHNAGAENADSSIRRKLYGEEAAGEEKSTWSTLTTLPEKKDPLVDAKQEKERLEKNKAEGKPVTEGDTPEARERDTGILGRMLGY